MGLTDLQVRKMAPRKARYEVLDNDGLYIRITPTGKKSWVFRYNFEGTARRMTLGSYPAFSLSEAREKHAQAMQDVDKRIDPGLKAQQEKARRKAEPNFKDLLDEFWDLELSLQKSAKERKRMVEKDVLKKWGKRKVSTITRRDAADLIDKVRERGAPVVANRLQSVLVRMFYFASERGIIEHSPLTGMKRGKEKAKSRVLEDWEIKVLWNALHLENTGIDIYRPVKLALKMILLTGQRPGEVSNMAWQDINDGWWTVPEGKVERGNSVPLLSMAQEILEMAKVISGENPFVFPSSHNECRPMTVRALSNAIRRHRGEMGIETPFTPHDLRRTLRTRLAGLGVADVVAEKVLGHKLAGMLAVYNQYDYASEKAEALMVWERSLKKIVGIRTNGRGNVIPITEARRHG